MRTHFLAGVTLTIFLGAQAAYPQAAAESVLLNGNSAAATAKAGTSMGNALNRAGSKVGSQVQQTVTHRATPISRPSGVNIKIERTPRTSVKPASAQPSAAASGPLITSIQGGHMSRRDSSTPK